ncbi:MAG: hypothetical protein KF745_13630 [Phycisphaeraceae bacterium]|nr:hypothetical protein [Phycisphaeraceae bacterium]
MTTPPISPPTQPPTLSPPANLDCVKCGYSLAGIPSNGRCPECGILADYSRRGVLLCYANPEFLARIHAGAVLVFMAPLLYIGMLVLSFAAAMLSAGIVTPVFSVGDLLFAMVQCVVSGVGLYGWWQLSTPDPRHGDSLGGGAARKTLRITVVIIGVGLVLTTIGAGWTGAVTPIVRGGSAGSGAGLMLGLLAIGAAVLSWIAWIVKFFASMVHIRTIARRIPSYVLAKRAENIMLSGSIITVGAIPAMLIGALLGPAILCPAIVLIVAWLVWIVMYILLLNHVRVALRDVKATSAGFLASAGVEGP